jgi:hypothetical protein
MLWRHLIGPPSLKMEIVCHSRLLVVLTWHTTQCHNLSIQEPSPTKKSLSLWKPKMSRMASPLHIHSSHSYFDWDFKYKEWHVHTQTDMICDLPIAIKNMHLLPLWILSSMCLHCKHYTKWFCGINRSISVESLRAPTDNLQWLTFFWRKNCQFSDQLHVSRMTMLNPQSAAYYFYQLRLFRKRKHQFFGRLSILNCMF